MLDALLNPESIAIVGQLSQPTQLGAQIVANLIEGGYSGKLVLVDPDVDEVMGHDCLSRLAEYSHKIDLVMVVSPVCDLLPMVEEILFARLRYLMVVTSDLQHENPDCLEMEEVERTLLEQCHAKGVRLLGPCNLGLINLHQNLNATALGSLPHAGPVSVVSQSSALAIALMDWVDGRNIGLAKVVSIGRKADLDEMEILQAFIDDSDTKVVVGYIESIRSGKEFVRVAESLASVKPVVVLKSGNTMSGERVVRARSGFTLDVDTAYGAAFERAGVIRVDSFESLLDYAQAFSTLPLPARNQVAVVTNAGGPGILAADALEESGLQLAQLSTKTMTELASSLPQNADVQNPIDIPSSTGPEVFAHAIQLVLEDPEVDALVVVLIPQALSAPEETVRAVLGCDRKDKLMVASIMGGKGTYPSRELLDQASVPCYPTTLRAARALGAVNRYASWRKRPARIVTRFAVNRRRAERIIKRHQRQGLLEVEDIHGKELLEAYYFSIPKGQLVSSAEEAVEVARRLSYPLAMKIASPDVIHKSGIGGVRLNLTSPEMLRDAYDLIMLRIKRHAPKARIDGLYVEEMHHGVEVVLGMTNDSQFGPMLKFGLGGVFVEEMGDVAFHLAPVTFDEAMKMLESTRSFSLLNGARDTLSVDVGAIAGGLQRISQLATDFPEIRELEINPFIVGSVGSEPIAADVRILLSEGALK